MQHAKTIKHVLTVEYECPETKTKHTVKIDNPHIFRGQYYSDWEYNYVEIKCESCGHEHSFEID